jgi:glycosyltransferase involved in cell wall biosynthesis
VSVVLENQKVIEPLVSVFIPVYNAEGYIEDAIDSVLNQTYQNFEIIVLNDGSTDQTQHILKELAKKDERIKIYKNEQNLGLTLTRNKGINLCKGEYIALLDADDLMVKQRIEKQIDFLKTNPDYDAVSSWMQIFDQYGLKQIIRYRETMNDYKSVSIFYSPISHAAALFKSSVIQKLGYRTPFKFAEDYDMWFRFLMHYKVAVIPEVLYLYRNHEAQTISDTNKKAHDYYHLELIRAMQDYFKIQSNIKNLNLHLQYCMNAVTLSSANQLIDFDEYMQLFLKSDNQYLINIHFKKFVFTNYWQTPFFKLWPQLNFLQRIKMLQSPFCQLSVFQKIKLILK